MEVEKINYNSRASTQTLQSRRLLIYPLIPGASKGAPIFGCPLLISSFRIKWHQTLTLHPHDYLSVAFFSSAQLPRCGSAQRRLSKGFEDRVKVKKKTLLPF